MDELRQRATDETALRRDAPTVSALYGGVARAVVEGRAPFRGPPALACAALLFATTLGPACSGERSFGLAPAHHTGGPHVVFDVLRKPLPEIPLPNDAATRLDPSSPTGRRVNIGLSAVTRIEEGTRKSFSRVDGFGTYAPITVAFDAPIDVLKLRALHADDDFRNDAVYLLNVDPSCKHFGDEIAIDMGRGRFPVVNRTKNRLFENDPHAEDNNLLYEEHDEDQNHNGVLDPGEDVDFDDHLDKPNVDVPGVCDSEPAGEAHDKCIADHLLTFYERESNTLILRPVWPLEQRCVHAVVLTDRLVGESGLAVDSPFEAVNARDQTAALRPVGELLGRYGLGVGNVAFAWTFTTGTITGELEAIRAGLYGSGTFARFATEFPIASLHVIPLLDKVAGGGLVEPGNCADMAMTLLQANPSFNGEPLVNMCAWGLDLQSIGGYVYGTYKSPNFLLDKNGIATPRYPADDDESFDIDATTGRAYYGPSDVTWWCALPRKGTGCTKGNPDHQPFCPPYPTIFYGHGYTGSRAEIQQWAGREAALGAATCAIDAFGHGLNVLEQLAGPSLAAASSLYDVADFGNVYALGRDRDLNNDGIDDPGGDFWTSDLFHTRDVVRQSVVDMMQFFRILRGFDGVQKDDAGRVAGDFDGDGEPDIGGPDAMVGAWGVSLGGITVGILGGVEPSLDAISPESGAAGLSDVAIRSEQGGVPESVLLPTIGPFVAGNVSTTSGKMELGFITNDMGNNRRVVFAAADEIAAGDRVEVTNVEKNVTRWALAAKDRSFRVEFPADALSATQKRPLLGLQDTDTKPVAAGDSTPYGDRLRVVVKDASGAVKRTVDTFERDTTFQGAVFAQGQPLVAVQGGLGIKRQTPEFRRFMGIAQNALDPADPASYAQHYFSEPLAFPYDKNARPRAHALVVPTGGDMSVPVNTGIAIARIAGILGSTARDTSIAPEHGWRGLFVPDARYGKSVDQLLIDAHVLDSVTRFKRYPDAPAIFPEALLDVDVLGDGRESFHCKEAQGDYPCTLPAGVDPTSDAAKFNAPALTPPLRQTIDSPDGAHQALRIPLLRAEAQHGINNARPWRPFDADTYMLNLTARYLISGGMDVSHRTGACGDCSGTAVPLFTPPPGVASPVGSACDATTQKLCDATCAAPMEMATPPEPLVCP